MNKRVGFQNIIKRSKIILNSWHHSEWYLQGRTVFRKFQKIVGKNLEGSNDICIKQVTTEKNIHTTNIQIWLLIDYWEGNFSIKIVSYYTTTVVVNIDLLFLHGGFI